MIGGLIFLAAATAAASLLAAADAALINDTPAEGEEPPSSRAVRDHAHRSLSLARLVSLLLSGAAVWLVIRDLDTHAERVVWGIVVALLVVAVVEGVARSIGDSLGSVALRPLRPIERLLRLPVAPVVVLGARIDSLLERAMPPHEDHGETRAATAEQFREIVSADAEVTRQERVLLDGVFTLRETAVREVMVPRVEVIAIDRETPWSEVVDRLRSTGHARLPVFKEEIDEIIGILYAKDLLPSIVADEEPAEGWVASVRPAIFIPATKTLDAQLRDFKSSGTHIAVVTDEYGGTAGIVTIEDILEEIVGEIRDEHDEEDAELEREGNDRFWVSGRLSIDDLSEATRHNFASDDVTTVGGLVYARLGRVPRSGETFVLDGFRVVVERVVRRRIVRVYFERLPVARVSGPKAAVETEQ
jgi:CBS domain containing-hemolysin-like protein